jgi:hypothetical protein
MEELLNKPTQVSLVNTITDTINIENRIFTIHKANKQKNDNMGRPLFITWHWSACAETELFDDYHFNVSINAAKTKPIVFRMLSDTQKGQHLWGRNTGAVGFSFNCLATTVQTKPTALMIEAGSVLSAEFCAWHRLDPAGSITIQQKQQTMAGDRLIETGQTILMPIVTDHASYAKVDGYYPDRIDIDTYLPILKKRTIDVYKDLKAGRRKFTYLDLLKQ